MEPSLVLKDGGPRPATVRPAPVLRPSADASDGADDGPYFDLEFSLPEDEVDEDGVACEGLRADDVDPGDDLFFRGHSSLLFTPSTKPQLPPSLVKSATRLRVFLLRFRRPKSFHSLIDDASSNTSPRKQQQQKEKSKSKKFLVKFKVEEVPIVSLFARDRGASRSSNSGSARSAKLYAEEAIQSPAVSVSDEKRNQPKDVIHKYLNKIKPLYDRASKRYSAGGDKRGFSGQLAGDEIDKKGSSSAGLRIVPRKLRKSQSASAAMAAPRSPARRRDDSLIQQEDGIQSAIAHCKRSFNAGSDSGLIRSMSDPGSERCDALRGKKTGNSPKTSV